ncbi:MULTISPECIES: hypothetical protein [Bacillati]|uniref:Uncharacterized protein n=1 Tax=Cytobacillus horneckiae TaxID=549687 RepID=A0A2N0ZIE3_9BACI|nr:MULTISPECIES: hypothetical protein [Terrabacteria group]MEC1159274.1 hypothetical protein [Cytobacillus horneckiae]PKG29280.1 hypothetical protein CWS20_09295 [Cytobacillus horneckiae]SGI84353.1 Uncharacterised protein [Mycobacterium tuberculosis]
MTKIQVKEEKIEKVFIQLKGYELGCLDGEIDAIENFMEADSGYICDVINESPSVPIYYRDIWEKAYKIQYYIEDLIDEEMGGLADSSLVQTFQYGITRYYEEVLHDNLESMIYNKLALLLNEALASLSDEEINEIDFEELEEELEDISKKIDHNDDLSIIQDKVAKIIDELIE